MPKLNEKFCELAVEFVSLRKKRLLKRKRWSDYVPWKTARIVVMFLTSCLRERQKKTSLITSAIYKIFVEGECEARPCGWRVKGAQRRGHPSLSVAASLTPGHIFFFFYWLWCPRSVFVLAAAHPPCRILLLMSHSCRLKPTTTASHTLMYVTRQSYRKCVFPFYDPPSGSH